jgi:hypothetical protein
LAACTIGVDNISFKTAPAWVRSALAH